MSLNIINKDKNNQTFFFEGVSKIRSIIYELPKTSDKKGKIIYHPQKQGVSYEKRVPASE